ncbi:MAG TPA: hypothetical protein VKZ53_00455 [Candidatus Angelobacter sp.]|nr:hypothetical protein [Candidatus Angelobacter sp.]
MNSTSVTFPGAFCAILLGGLGAGVGDITQAFIIFGMGGRNPMSVLQTVAAGVLGMPSFKGGTKSAALGALLHFTIAFGAAIVFFVASRQIGFLTQRPILAGLLYGEIVFVVMNYIVLPLSALHRIPPMNIGLFITGPIGHPLLVGLPISLAVYYLAK